MPKVTNHTSNNLVTVSYPVREVVLDITKAEHDLIVSFSHERVKMIKFIRSQYNLGSYAARQVVATVIASAEVKPEVQAQGIVKETVVDWNAVPEGTMIYVRDSETDPWNIREFLYIDNLNGCGMPFICLNSFYHRTTVNWAYAKLITD